MKWLIEIQPNAKELQVRMLPLRTGLRRSPDVQAIDALALDCDRVHAFERHAALGHSIHSACAAE